MADERVNERAGRKWSFVLEQERRGERLVMRLSGRLPASAAPQLAEALAAAVASGERRIFLNMRGLDYVSSAAILSLEAAAARLRSENGELVLCAPPAPVRMALQLAGFPDDVPVLAEDSD